MKILFTCKGFPHAQVIGGPIIIYNRLKYLSKNHLVSLAAFFRPGEEKFAWVKGVEIMEGVLEKMMKKNHPS
jgi:hypothetical protein